MGINRDNYEAYLLDQMEGRLSEKEQQELRNFLVLNPDCALEAELEDAQILPCENIPFPNKDSLKKEIPDFHTTLSVENFDLYSIARMEGDLTEQQASMHELLLQEQPELRSDWEKWLQTRIPAEHISYPWKQSIKRKVPAYRRISWPAILSTAAAVALVAILFIFRGNDADSIASEESFRMPAIEQPEVEVPVTPPVVRHQPTSAAVDEMEAAMIIPDLTQAEVVSVTDSSSYQLQGENEEELPVSSRPLRAALAANTIPAPVIQGHYDRIRPLQIPETPVHMNGVSITMLAEMDLQEVVEVYTEEKDISIWTIANAGIKGINRITGSNIALFAARDDEGEISGFHLKSRRLSITSPLEREE
jgi:hypothetical protein